MILWLLLALATSSNFYCWHAGKEAGREEALSAIRATQTIRPIRSAS